MITRDAVFSEAIATDWRTAAIDARLRAILAFAEKLTLAPAAMEAADILPLREAGLEDRAILEVVEVTAYFNFVNRLADGLGVSVEPRAPRNCP